MVSPQARRQAVEVLQAEHGFGVTRACGLVKISRSLYRYRSRRPDCAQLRQRMGEMVDTSITGTWRIEYNTERPHSSLGDRTPVEFAALVTEAYR